MKRVLLFPLLLIALATQAQAYQPSYEQVQQQFLLRSAEAASELKAYLEQYPYSPYIDEVKTMQGILLTEKKKFKQAEKVFASVKASCLSRQSEPDYYFYRAYELIQQQSYKDAVKHLSHLKSDNNPYTVQALYYTGYCYYRTGDYAQALPEFLEVERRGAFMDVVPYYIVQIDYAHHRYDAIEQRALRLLQSYPDNPHNTELRRILGEIYYQQANYTDAVQMLSAAQQSMTAAKQSFPRSDFYLLGMSHYRLQHYSEAVDAFKQVREAQDSITQSTCLHLGHCYLKMGDEQKAKLAYAAATHYTFNAQVREEAMFNYLQITYHESSALGESIQAFRQFLTDYPHTKYADHVLQLLSDMLRTSRDYAGALDALNDIQQTSAQIEDTKQFLRYQLAVDAVLRGDIGQALSKADEVLSHATKSSSYRTEALYLKAECLYRQQLLDSCLMVLQTYEKQPRVSRTTNYGKAMYMKAYALFNTRQMSSAASAFALYMQLTDSTDRTFADALNRIGDCRFNSRLFADACTAYSRVIALHTYGTDYALFRMGEALGLLHRYDDEIMTFTRLTTDYPQSDYAAEALYETARAHLQQNHNHQALAAYSQLLEAYPHAPLAAKASLETAMVYRALHQYDQATTALKHTIETFPGSEEAYAALESLEQLCVETNRFDEYIAYSKSLNRLHMQTLSREDSLLYVTAETQYMNAHYPEAVQGMQRYMATYCPGGRFCTAALHYIAEGSYLLHDSVAAREAYYQLADIPGNPYLSEAYMRIAEICFDQGEYRTAALYFLRLDDNASMTSVHQTARLGLLRCFWQLGDNASVIDAATTLLETAGISDDIRQEALYDRAKAYMAQSQYGLAVVDFTPLATEVRTAMGAEAKYQLAQCYFNLGSTEMAEAEVMSFTKMPTTQQYWLARGLILLSDIAVANDDLFQAKQYLLALQSNYHHADDIGSLVTSRLELIAARESQSHVEQPVSEDTL